MAGTIADESEKLNMTTAEYVRRCVEFAAPKLKASRERGERRKRKRSA